MIIPHQIRASITGLTNSAKKFSFVIWRHHLSTDWSTSRRASKDCDSILVPTKVFNISINPFDSHLLVPDTRDQRTSDQKPTVLVRRSLPDTKIASMFVINAGQKTKSSKSIIHIDNNDILIQSKTPTICIVRLNEFILDLYRSGHWKISWDFMRFW